MTSVIPIPAFSDGEVNGTPLDESATVVPITTTEELWSFVNQYAPSSDSDENAYWAAVSETIESPTAVRAFEHENEPIRCMAYARGKVRVVVCDVADRVVVTAWVIVE